MSYTKSKIMEMLERRDIAWLDVVRIVEVGSSAHGISVPETGDDLDVTVVRMETYRELVVGNPKRQSMMIRTAPEGVRSQAGDIDLNVYTLRKFARLAANGNPSILAAIFSPLNHHAGSITFSRLGELVTSKRAGAAFLGYMGEQIKRWTGEKGQKNVNRPELVEAYGFDTKYAAHVIRLGLEGIEYMRTGQFTMPMPEHRRNLIIGIRTGLHSEVEVLDWADQIKSRLKLNIEASQLPERVDMAHVDDWVLQAYMRTAQPLRTFNDVLDKQTVVDSDWFS